jgi:hypothetical protein
MKNTFKYLSSFLVLVVTLLINQSCSKPFEEVNAILTNVKINHGVNVQIMDANPAATNPYPSNPVVTLEGDAVDQGLIYSTAGELLTTAPGSAAVVNSTVNLAVKPLTIISATKPLRFYIKAEAANYISNTKEIVITSLDSLQTVKLPLLKIASLPSGVAIKTAQATAVAGELSSNFNVNVVLTTPGTPAPETIATATFPATTDFKDATGKVITTAGNFNIVTVGFNAASSEAATSLPGGLTVEAADGTPATIVLAGAVDINASIGGSDIKSFSEPIPFTLKLSPTVFNPSTNSTLKVGDQLPVYSKNDNSVLWVRESTADIVSDGTGGLKVTMQVTHLSTWMVGFIVTQCASDLKLNYISNNDEPITAIVNVNVKGGNKQLVTTKTVTVKNGEDIVLNLPKDLAFTITAFDASSTSTVPFSTIDVAACATSGTIRNNVVSANPSLSFDLETQCADGKFRYSGPIEFKLAGTNVWRPFTASEGGKLTTKLLEWDKTYDFRIIYRDVAYVRSRKVLEAEFRQVGNGWEFFGKTAEKQTFFTTPTSCQ